MSNTNCTCTTGIGNLGEPSCIKDFGLVHKLIAVYPNGSDGTANEVLSSQAIDQSFIDDKIQELEERDRWYVSPQIRDFEPTKEDPTYQDFDDGGRVQVRDGRRSYAGKFIDADPKFLEQLETIKCAGGRFYIISNQNHFQGMSTSVEGTVAPLPIENLYAMFNYATGSVKQDVSFTLDLPIIVKDTMLISRYDVTGDLVNAEGLFPLLATLDNATASTMDITIQGAGTFGNSSPFIGLVATDLSAYDVTDDSAGTIASIAATATEGVYTITFTGATSTNVMRISATTVLTAKGYIFPDVQLALG